MFARARISDLEISTHSLTRRLTKKAWREAKGMCISTHSLTRRLTTKILQMIAKGYISTHSLTRRLTRAECSSMIRPDFNSQPHKEADIRLAFQLFF